MIKYFNYKININLLFKINYLILYDYFRKSALDWC